MFGVDMHNEGQNAFPGEAVSLAQVVQGGGRWSASASAMLAAGDAPTDSFRKHASALLWCAWSGCNVRRPGELTQRLSPGHRLAADELLREFEPEARRRIKPNAYIA